MTAEIISKSFETNGTNLLNGLKQFLEDVEKGKKPTLDRRSDYPQFKVLKDAMR